MTLDDLRRDIDRVDEVLVRLLNERARCVCEIGRLKKELNIEVYQPDREKDVLRELNLVVEAHLVIREGELVTEDELLADKDQIEIRPVISGGVS